MGNKIEQSVEEIAMKKEKPQPAVKYLQKLYDEASFHKIAYERSMDMLQSVRVRKATWLGVEDNVLRVKVDKLLRGFKQ